MAVHSSKGTLLDAACLSELYKSLAAARSKLTTAGRRGLSSAPGKRAAIEVKNELEASTDRVLTMLDQPQSEVSERTSVTNGARRMDELGQEDERVIVKVDTLHDLHKSLTRAQTQLAAAGRSGDSSVAGRKATYAVKTELEMSMKSVEDILKQYRIDIPTPQSAADKVFNIIELLEMIYENLDLWELLSATQV